MFLSKTQKDYLVDTVSMILNVGELEGVLSFKTFVS